MQVPGIDGCKGGWIGILTDPSFSAPRAIGTCLAGMIAGSMAEVVVTDMPVGLSATESPRRCDVAARGVLRCKVSPVFNTPIRPVLEAVSYDDTSDISRRVTGKGLSRQAWGILPRIREGHPELSFALADHGQPVPASKKSRKGQPLRLQILSGAGFRIENLDLANLPPRTALDHLIDAAIMAWSAIRLAEDRACLFPDTLLCDDHGLPMKMVA